MKKQERDVVDFALSVIFLVAAVVAVVLTFSCVQRAPQSPWDAGGPDSAAEDAGIDAFDPGSLGEVGLDQTPRCFPGPCPADGGAP